MTFDRKFWHPACLLFFSLSFTFFYIIVLSKTPFFIHAQYKVSDALFSYQSASNSHFLKKIVPPPKTTFQEQIVVIGIDDESMLRLDRSWPWGREVFAAFLKKIRPFQPKVIAFDLLFVGKSQNKEADLWLAEEIEKSGNVILASYLNLNSILFQYVYLLPSELFLKAAKTTGFIDVPYDRDGTVRRSSLLFELADDRGFAYSMPVQLAGAYEGLLPQKSVAIRRNKVVFLLPSKKDPSIFKKTFVPLDREYRIPISFRYSKKEIRYLPFWKIIAGQVSPEALKGKIVLVGMTSNLMRDVHATPIGSMPGVFIIAQQTLMILERDFIKKVWPNHHWIFLLILAAVFTILFYRLHYGYGLIVLLAAEFAIYEFAIWLFLSQQQLFNVFSTMLVLPFAYLVVPISKGVLLLLESATLHHQIVTDSLTGLYNHAYISRHLKAAFEHYRQLGKEFCFAMIDIDFFKKINDTYGHEQGNQVLARIAESLRNGIRKSDVVARYGGEEFSMILFDCDIPTANQILEKIRRVIEGTTFTSPKGNFNATISAGVCSNRERELNRAADIIRLADETLYRAKAEGRNRVCTYKPPISRFIYSTR